LYVNFISNNSYKVKKLNKKEDINNYNDKEKFIYLVDDYTPIKLIMEARIHSRLPIILKSEGKMIKGIIREEEIFKKMLKK